MEENPKILKIGKDYDVQLLAEGVEIINHKILNENSLGPFLRISQNTDNIIYLVAYFNTGITVENFELKQTIGGSISHQDNEVPTYKLDLKVTKQTKSVTKQNLWAFIIKANVDLSKLKLVICDIDFNHFDVIPEDIVNTEVRKFYHSSKYHEFEKNFDHTKHIDLQPYAKRKLKKLRKKIKKKSNLKISISEIAYMLSIFLGAPKRGTKVIIMNVTNS